jgi:hypothetical protein
MELDIEITMERLRGRPKKREKPARVLGSVSKAKKMIKQVSAFAFARF